MAPLTRFELRRRYETCVERVKCFATSWLDGGDAALEYSRPFRDVDHELSTADFTAHIGGYLIARLLAFIQAHHGIDGRAVWRAFLADRALQDTPTSHRTNPPGDAS